MEYIGLFYNDNGELFPYTVVQVKQTRARGSDAWSIPFHSLNEGSLLFLLRNALIALDVRTDDERELNPLEAK